MDRQSIVKAIDATEVPVSRDVPESLDGAEPLGAPAPLGFIVREYLKSLRPLAERAPLALGRGASPAVELPPFVVRDDGRVSPVGSWPQRGVHPKSRFCLISSATAGGT